MTFRSASLIHKRCQQSQGRIVPGATPTADTLVAAVFLLTTTGARADCEGQDKRPACDGLSPISLTANSEGAARGDRRGSDGAFACSFTGTWENPDLGFHFTSECESEQREGSHS